MAGMLSNTDDEWAAYRQKAAAQTEALNAAPFVLDPAKLGADPKANVATLYGAATAEKMYPSPVDPNAGFNADAVRAAVSDSIRKFYGREAGPGDFDAWLASAQQHNLSGARVAAAIQESQKNPELTPLINWENVAPEYGGTAGRNQSTGLGFNSGIGRGFGMNSAIF